ncbi:MAG: mevalonate kinase [Deltaproteobacteria bacterium]|nr:mevalonate kinase [Deltaproteobacteria bacterium]
MTNTAMGFGGGKIILVGEHAVVHGTPAIAAGIRRGVSSIARPADQDSLHVEPWGRTWRPNAKSEEPLERAFERILSRYADRPPLRFVVRVALPPGAGLGCSAAIGVSLIDAIDKALGVARSRAELGALALEWERFFHGDPSGIDNLASALGGLLCYRRSSPPRRISPKGSIFLVVAHSGQRSNTKEMVARVSQRLAGSPEWARRALDEVKTLAIDAEAAIRSGDLIALGAVLNRNHEILRSLNLSTNRLEALCREARSAGALGAKITGAGGGGCMVALAAEAEHADRISGALAAESFVEEVGRAA